MVSLVLLLLWFLGFIQMHKLRCVGQKKGSRGVFVFLYDTVCEHAAEIPDTCESSAVPSQRGNPVARRSERCWLFCATGACLAARHSVCPARCLPRIWYIAWLLDRSVLLVPFGLRFKSSASPLSVHLSQTAAENGVPYCHVMLCVPLRLQITHHLVCSWVWHFTSIIPVLGRQED